MNHYIRKSSCETIVLDDETMILNPESLTITKISQVGGFCWSQLSAAQSVHTLSAAVQEHYGDTELSVEQDITEFLFDLLECGLIEAKE
ncbi:MAG: PqqD family protein [Gorillibacterium sp.]|nr:PqqD family protein [Gorillibacterium sp.]